jgi:hypothetical protein
MNLEAAQVVVLRFIFARERPVGADSLRQCSVRDDPLTFGLVLWL